MSSQNGENQAYTEWKRTIVELVKSELTPIYIANFCSVNPAIVRNNFFLVDNK